MFFLAVGITVMTVLLSFAYMNGVPHFGLP